MQARRERVLQTGKEKIGRRIERGALIIDDTVPIFRDARRRRPQKIPELFSESMFHAILKRSRRAIILEQPEGVTADG